MRLFKKHKAKDKLVLNLGIKECRTCDINIRCEECVYMKKNETLLEEIEKLKIEKDELIKVFRESQVANLKAFVNSLCKDRVSNDPVVIAVQVELKEWLGDKE